MVGKCGITLWQDDQQAAWEPLHVCAAAKIEELSRLLGSVDRTLLLLQLGNCWQDHRQTSSGSSRKQITVQSWYRLVEPLPHTVTNLSNLTQTHSNLPEFWKPNLWGIAYSRKIIGTRFAHRLKLREGVKKRFLGKVLHYWWAPPPSGTLSYHAGLVSWLEIGVRSTSEVCLQTPYRDFFIPSWHWRSLGCLHSWSWWSYYQLQFLMINKVVTIFAAFVSLCRISPIMGTCLRSLRVEDWHLVCIWPIWVWYDMPLYFVFEFGTLIKTRTRVSPVPD